MQNSAIDSYNKQIDGLRCFAVLGVLVFHFMYFENIFLARFPFGQGVNLFFVISGYLITKILLVSKEKIEEEKTTKRKVVAIFYFKRFLRIFPIYYLTIFFLLIIGFQNTRDVWVWLVTYATNFYISIDHFPYIGSFHHLWSLAVEEQFYLIWPFLILFIPKKYIERIIIGIILLALLFKITYYQYFGWSSAINALTISCADSLGFGALIAYWSLYRKSLIDKITKIRFVVLISFLPYIYFMIYPRKFDFITVVANNFLFSVTAFFIVMKASQVRFSSLTKFLLENKVALHLGKISYGIYLYHFFMPDFYNYMVEMFPNYFSSGTLFRIPFLLLSSIAFAECSWYLLEKPVMKFKGKFQYS